MALTMSSPSSIIHNNLISGQHKSKVLRRELHGKIEDEALVAEVLRAFPKKVETTLGNYRATILGKVPSTREDYDPSMILSSLSGADNIMVLDSNDLPQGWRDVDLRTLFTEDQDPVLDEEDEDQDVRRPSNPGVQPIFDTTMDEELERSRDAPVPRVLIFTTLHLLGLLTLCKRANLQHTSPLSGGRDHPPHLVVIYHL